MSEALTLYQSAPIKPRQHDAEEVALFADSYAKGCSPTEVRLAVAVAEQLGLSLLSRQIYALKRWDGQAGREVMQIQVGIDGFRAQADRSGLWAGYDPPRWMDEQGNWHDDWLDLRKFPYAASVKVYRHGFAQPVEAKVYFHERAQYKKGGELTSMWKTKPLTMLGKCALAEALRGAFPVHLGGVYAPEELPPADADMIEGEVVSSSSKPAAIPPPPPKSTRARSNVKPTNTTAAPPSDNGAEARKAFWSCVTSTDGVLQGEGGELDKDQTRAAVVRRLRLLEQAEVIPPSVLPLADTSQGLADWLATYQAAEVQQIVAAYKKHAAAEREAEEVDGAVEAAFEVTPGEQAVVGMFDGLPT